MLWNWNTADVCLISSSWQITSDGMFAGSCIGVILLVMVLEALRRATKIYDRYLVCSHAARTALLAPSTADVKDAGNSSPRTTTCPAALPAPCRPTVLQQAVRALLHMLQFATAYFIMLLAMYYNGYILICIFLGAYLGAFIFQWETLATGLPTTSAGHEATVCCG